MLGKFLFSRTPEMTPTQLLFLRSFISSLIFLCLMGNKTKFYLVDSIDHKHYMSIVWRVLNGILMLVCVYTSVKYLPLVYISLSQNLSPLLTAVMSYFFFKKGLNMLDTAVLIISFGGVVLMITSASSLEG